MLAGRLFAAAFLLCLGSLAGAAVPQRLNYQGKLADASGNPLSGTYSFRFKLFAAETGGAALFSEDVSAGNAVSVVNGIYSVQIGSYTSGGIPYGVFDNQHLYLEIDVAAGISLASAETLTPRERLNSAAWAVHALGAERLGTGAVIATFTATGALELPAGSTVAFNGTLTLSTAASAAQTGLPALFVSRTGNVGIGTGAPGSSPPSGSGGGSGSRFLDMRAGAGGTDDGGLLMRRPDGVLGLDLWYDNSDGATYIDQRFSGGTSKGIVFRTATQSAPVQALVIRSDGNVGISTPSPQLPLDVNGAAQLGLGGLKSTFTATPNNTTFALYTSSGIRATAGGVVAAFFEGMFKGDGSRLTSVTGTDNTKVLKTGDSMSGNLTFDYGAGDRVFGNQDQSTPGSAAINLTVKAGGAAPSGAAGINGGSLYLTGGTDDGANSSGGSVFVYGANASGGVSTVSGNVHLGHNGTIPVGRVAVGKGSVPSYTLEVEGDSGFGTGGAKSVFSSVGALTMAGNVNLLQPGANAKHGINTATPVTGLDVSTAAQFGAAALKSTFTATPGGSVYALRLSSGLVIANTGGVVAAFFNGVHTGDGSLLTGKVSKTGDSMSGPLTVNPSSITVINSNALDSFSFAVTSAPNRGVYHLSVSTMGQVDIGHPAFTVGGASFVVTGVGAAAGASSPAFIGNNLSLAGRTIQVFHGQQNANLSIRSAGTPGIWHETGLGFANRRLWAEQVITGQITWRNFNEQTGALNQDQVLVLTSTGAVGVGVSPRARLHVSSGTTATTDNIVLVSTTNGTATTNLFRVQANGNVFSAGAFTGGGADLAEMYRSEPDVEAGDVVEFAPDGRLRRATSASRRVMGVVSTSPGSLLGWDISRSEMPEHRPLALAGRVPVRVTLENGPVRRGDALAASSTPGAARRAGPGEPAVAVALEDLDAPGQVLAYVRGADPAARAELDALKAENERLRRDVEELKALMKAQGGSK